MNRLKKTCMALAASAAMLVPTALVAAPAEAVGPNGIEVCSSPASIYGSTFRWYQLKYSDGPIDYYGPWLQPGECSDGYNGNGNLRIEYSSIRVASWKWGILNQGYTSCKIGPLAGGPATADPPNAANGTRLTIRTYRENDRCRVA